MLGQIRRHQKWLWVLVAGGTIISFIIFMDPSVGRRGRGFRRAAGGSADFGYSNGHAISREEYYDAYKEAVLGFKMYSGRWPGEDEGSRQLFDPDRRIQQRLLLIEKLNQMNITVPDSAVIERLADMFRDPKQGTIHMEDYERFVTDELPQIRLSGDVQLTRDDFERFVRHDVGIQQLYQLGGLSGSLVVPREADALYRHENEQVVAEVVLFTASNYLATITLDPVAVKQFYTNNLPDYYIPEKVQVGYVKFDATNFLAEADRLLSQQTNLNQAIEQFYMRRGPESYKDSEGKTLSREAALKKIRDEEQHGQAMNLAQKKGADFLQELFGLYEKEPKSSDNLERLASASGLQSAVTEPFARSEPPRDLKVADSFADVAFALSPDQPVPTEPLVGTDAVYVIAYKKKIPRELQPFDAVRDKVIEEYRRREADQAARKAGQAFYATLTNGFAQNKSFQAVCLEANVLTVKPPPFSLAARSLPGWDGRMDLGVLQDATANLATGGTSGFVRTRDGGLIVNITSRQPVDEAKMKAELPAYLERIRQERHAEAFNEWIRKETEQARISHLPQFKKSGPQQND